MSQLPNETAGASTMAAEQSTDSPLLIERVLAPFERFVQTESASGLVLLACTTLALALGIALGLIAGKPVGITLFAWVAVRLGFATLPHGVTWRSIVGAGLLAGIGFTMAIFIAGLAFVNEPGLLVAPKLGILGAWLVAGLAGWLVLRRGALRP